LTPLLVALGAAIGAPSRYIVAHFLDRRLPWGTLAVNLIGSFVLGLLAGEAVSGSSMALLGTGFCGGLTTYSSFAVQAIDRGPRLGSTYVVLTIAGCLALAALGYQVG
jgi:CrcB protein